MIKFVVVYPSGGYRKLSLYTWCHIPTQLWSRYRIFSIFTENLSCRYEIELPELFIMEINKDDEIAFIFKWPWNLLAECRSHTLSFLQICFSEFVLRGNNILKPRLKKSHFCAYNLKIKILFSCKVRWLIVLSFNSGILKTLLVKKV